MEERRFVHSEEMTISKLFNDYRTMNCCQEELYEPQLWPIDVTVEDSDIEYLFGKLKTGKATSSDCFYDDFFTLDLNYPVENQRKLEPIAELFDQDFWKNKPLIYI